MININLLDLRWHVDSEGYVLQPAKASSSALLARSFFAHASPGFIDADFLYDECWYAHVVPRGGQLKSYRWKVDDPTILLDLLNMRDTPEGVLGFVKKRGLLGAPELEKSRSVDWFICSRDVMGKLVLHGSLDGLPGSAGEFELASLKLVRGPTGQLCHRADTLGDFLWAQASTLKPRAVIQCPVCKRFALAPRTGRPPKYCSDTCSSKAYRQGLTTRRSGSPRVRAHTEEREGAMKHRSGSPRARVS
jgi:hypothetical protein